MTVTLPMVSNREYEEEREKRNSSLRSKDAAPPRRGNTRRWSSEMGEWVQYVSIGALAGLIVGSWLGRSGEARQAMSPAASSSLVAQHIHVLHLRCEAAVSLRSELNSPNPLLQTVSTGG